MSSGVAYNLRPRPCRSGIVDTSLPNRCRVTTVDLSATGCWRTILVTTAEHNCGCFVGVGQKECPDNIDWQRFLHLWMSCVTETPLPFGVSEILIVVEREPNPYATDDENALTRRNNEMVEKIVRELPIVNKHVRVCQKFNLWQDMYWEPLAIVRGGLDPFEPPDADDEGENDESGERDVYSPLYSETSDS